jgi:hypothetical protein
VNELRRCEVARAPVEAVWAVLEDVRRLEQLSSSTTAVVGPERLTAAGQTFTQTVEVAGRSFSSEWTVDRLEAGRRIALSGRLAPGVRAEMDEELRPVDGGTEVCLTMRYRLPFGPLGRVVGRLGLVDRAERGATEVLRNVCAAAEGRLAPT